MAKIQINGKTYTATLKDKKRSPGAKPYWSVKLTVGKDPVTGKQKQHEFTGESIEKLLESINAVLPGHAYPVSSDITVGYILNEWYKLHHKGWAKSTRETTEILIRCHLMPAFGECHLAELTEEMVQQFIYTLFDRGLSRTYIRTIAGVLRNAIDYAKKKNLIIVNPCHAVIIPQKPAKLHTSLTRDEIQKLYSEIFNSDYKNLILCCLICGFRIGECLALTWDCIDFDKHTITLKNHFVYAADNGGKHQQFLEPGTKNGRVPVLPMPLIAFEYLADEKERQFLLKNRSDSSLDLVFTTRKGKPVQYCTISHYFKAVMQKIGRPDASLHTLRRTAATQSLELSNDLRAVQRMLNHINLSTTMRYVDTTREAQERLARCNDAYYRQLLQNN